MRLIPPHGYGPPERCYWTKETDLPGLVVNPFGHGTSVYFPWCPGSLFHREGHDNTIVFVHDVLKQLAKRKMMEGLPPQVEATLAAPPDGSFTLLQLVNTSGHFGATFYEPIPMARLNIILPHDHEPQRALRLSDGESVPFRFADGNLELSLSLLEAFEAIKLHT